MLKVNNIEVVYSDVILVLRGVSLEVGAGQIVALLGANGAGKSTTLKAISGLLHTQEGEVTRGSVDFDGERVDDFAKDPGQPGAARELADGHQGWAGSRAQPWYSIGE